MTARSDTRGNWFVVAHAGLDPAGHAPVPDSARRLPCNPPAGCTDDGCPSPVDGAATPVDEIERDDLPASPPTVYVVAAEAALRDEVRAVLRGTGVDVRVLAWADDCVRAVSAETLTCVVADAALPEAIALDVLRGLAAQCLTVPVIAITDHGGLATAVAAMKAGAFDVLERPAVATRLIGAIRAALAEQELREQQRQARGEVRRRYAELTAREREVFHLVAAGFRSRAIADRLGIREKTVEVYRSRVNHKMNAHNAAELARMSHCIEL